MSLRTAAEKNLQLKNRNQEVAHVGNETSSLQGQLLRRKLADRQVSKTLWITLAVEACVPGCCRLD